MSISAEKLAKRSFKNTVYNKCLKVSIHLIRQKSLKSSLGIKLPKTSIDELNHPNA